MLTGHSSDGLTNSKARGPYPGTRIIHTSSSDNSYTYLPTEVETHKTLKRGWGKTRTQGHSKPRIHNVVGPREIMGGGGEGPHGRRGEGKVEESGVGGPSEEEAESQTERGLGRGRKMNRKEPKRWSSDSRSGMGVCFAEHVKP